MQPKLVEVPLEAPSFVPRIDPRHACFALAIGESSIHRHGVYARERIPANRKVIEYTGERIGRHEAKRRDRDHYTYLFALDDYMALDGSVGGSGAEFINHSCEPNLISRIMKGHILYMSLRPIGVGEELTIDYHFAPGKGPRTPCYCGASKCRGSIEKPRAPHPAKRPRIVR